MSFNRRDLFKAFGVGAIVAPVLNGAVSAFAPQARIIEPPKVEIISDPKIEVVQAIPEDKIKSWRIELEMESGAMYELKSREGSVLNAIALRDDNGMPYRSLTEKYGYQGAMARCQWTQSITWRCPEFPEIRRTV